MDALSLQKEVINYLLERELSCERGDFRERTAFC